MFRRIAPTLGSAFGYLLLACIAYWPVLIHGQFLCDDFILLDRVKHGEGLWNHPGVDFYRPAISVALTGLWRLFGSNPFPYHLFNVLLLAGTGLFLQSAWESLASRGTQVRFSLSAFVVGALFVVWMTHSESVSWISGVTDGLAVFFGAAALAAFARYLKRPSVAGFCVSIVLLWLGLLGKEAVIAFVPIFIVFAFATEGWRGRWRVRAAEAAVLCIVGVGYVAWRAHVIGELIGGYGAKAHLNLMWGPLDIKISKHLANAFLPFNRLVALWVNFNWVALLTATVCVGSFALFLRKLPNQKRAPRWAAICFQVAIGVGLIQLLFYYLPEATVEAYGSRILIAALILMGVLVEYLRRKKVEIRLDTTVGFASVSLLVVMLHANTILGHFEWHLPVLYLAFAYLMRPVRETSESDKTLIRLGLASFVAVFLAIGPAATLRIDLSGEGSRFSYAPSVFGAFALAAVALLYLRGRALRSISSGLAIAASTGILFSFNVPWAQASDISAETTRVVKSLLPARRIYALIVPGTVTAASLFRIGIDHLPSVTTGDSKVEMRPMSYLAGAAYGDRVRVVEPGAFAFKFDITPNESIKRFSAPFIEQVEPEVGAGWARIDAAGSLAVDGFDPKKDHIISIDCRSVTVIW